MNNTTKPIVYITDNNYVDYTLTSIKSLLLSVRVPVKIYVICDGVKEYNKQRLKIANEIVLVDYKNDYASKYGQYRHVSSAMFIKFDIPKLIPEDVCLYVDGDTIIRDDITTIFSYDITNHLAAVMKDFGRTYIWKKESDYVPFYAGTLLLNLKLMRKEKISKELHRVKSELLDSSVWNEMEIINKVFSNRVLYIPIRFCISLEKILFGKREEYRKIALYNELYETEYKDINELIADAAIFHFHGDKSKVYAHREFYELIDEVEERFLHKDESRVFIFSNVCRFEDSEAFCQEISKLDIHPNDTLIFLNTAPWLKFINLLPEARIISIHRFKRDASGWWGLEDTLERISNGPRKIKTLLLDNAGNISQLNGKIIAHIFLYGYPKENMPTTGFFAYYFARQLGHEDIRLVNFYGTKDNSTPHFRPHGWNYEERTLSDASHIHLEPNGKSEILMSPPPKRFKFVPNSSSNIKGNQKAQTHRIYYGNINHSLLPTSHKGWNW